MNRSRKKEITAHKEFLESKSLSQASVCPIIGVWACSTRSLLTDPQVTQGILELDERCASLTIGRRVRKAAASFRSERWHHGKRSILQTFPPDQRKQILKIILEKAFTKSPGHWSSWPNSHLLKWKQKWVQISNYLHQVLSQKLKTRNEKNNWPKYSEIT